MRAHLEALTKLPAGDAPPRGGRGIATSEAEHLAVVNGLRGEPRAARPS